MLTRTKGSFQHIIGALTVSVAVLAPSSLLAEDRSAREAMSVFQQAYQAEHRAWGEDVRRWRMDHEQAQKVIKAMLKQFQGDSQISRHMDAIEKHGEVLADEGDAIGSMAEEHARRRALHEEMREAHHHLMEAISMLERSVERDLGPATSGSRN